MARTVAASVRGVLLNDYDLEGAPSLEVFIETARVMVDAVQECATRKGTPLSDAKLEILETWLAAHYYACSDRPYTQKATERASGRFDGQTKMYLEATLYGQTAARLDPSGCLSSIAGEQNRRAGAFWLGRRPSEQTDYFQRD